MLDADFSPPPAISRTLDSSEVLRAENCRVRIREVILMRPTTPTATCVSLEEAINTARSLGYVLHTLGIVNICHGGPQANEPKPALLFYRECGAFSDYFADAIVVENLDDRRRGTYNFYVRGEGFSYIE